MGRIRRPPLLVIGGVDVADEDALADEGGVELAEVIQLRGGGSGDVEAGYSVGEPEAGDGGEVGGLGVESDQDTEAAVAGLMDEVVEVVCGADCRVDVSGGDAVE